VDTLGDLFASFRSCLAGVAGPAGSQLTMRFSLRNNGALVAEPHITYSVAPPGTASARPFENLVLSAFARCAPFDLDPRLGAAIAGRPMTIRVVESGPGRKPSADVLALMPAQSYPPEAYWFPPLQIRSAEPRPRARHGRLFRRRPPKSLRRGVRRLHR
jgi:hypothetical protein